MPPQEKSFQWKIFSPPFCLATSSRFFLNFPELFIIEKYVKIWFKNTSSPCYFLSFRGQKIKNITKVEQKGLFLLLFLVSLVMAFLPQKLIHRINIWFNFVFGSFDSNNLNYFRSSCEKMISMCKYFKTPDVAQNLVDDFIFFLTLTVREPFHWKDFEWRKISWYSVNFWKNGSFVCRT